MICGGKRKKEKVGCLIQAAVSLFKKNSLITRPPPLPPPLRPPAALGPLGRRGRLGGFLGAHRAPGALRGGHRSLRARQRNLHSAPPAAAPFAAVRRRGATYPSFRLHAPPQPAGSAPRSHRPPHPLLVAGRRLAARHGSPPVRPGPILTCRGLPPVLVSTQRHGRYPPRPARIRHPLVPPRTRRANGSTAIPPPTSFCRHECWHQTTVARHVSWGSAPWLTTATRCHPRRIYLAPSPPPGPRSGRAPSPRRH